MSAKESFLRTYDTEHETTMRLLRAYPKDKLDVRPHPKLKTAGELAFLFVLEAYLGIKVWHDEFAKQTPGGAAPPKAPSSLDEIINAVEKASKEWRTLISNASEAELAEKVHFFTGPKTMGEYTRMNWAWFLLHDQIHHRGQLSVYLRMAGGKVPSIYGPTADEPWN